MIWWVAQNVVVTALLAGVVWIICKTTRIGPATRHALWLVVLLKLVTPPLVVWPWGVNDLFATLNTEPTAESEAVVLTEPVESIEVDLPTFASPVHSAEEIVIADLIEGSNEPIDVLIEPVESEVSGILLTQNADRSDETWTAWLTKASWPVWLAGAIVFALLQMIRIVRLFARLRRGEAPHRDVIEQVTAMSNRLRIKPVETRSVDGVGSPCIWAFLRPRLLWPAELSLKILPNALRGIIVHELAHVKRRDHWVGWLELVAGCVWWWNPLFWYVRHQLRENAELACDAWVVGALPAGRRAYAEALLAVCESVSGLSAPFPAVGASAGGRQAIERRLNMILRGQNAFRLSRGGLLAALILAAMALPAWSQRSVTIEEKDQRLGSFRNVAEVDSAYSTDFVTNAQLDDSVKAVAGKFVSRLPADAQKILKEHRRLEEEARREAERQALKRRQTLIRELRALQDRYTRAGKLDEAVAVRDEIERLQGQGPRLSLGTAGGVPIAQNVPQVGRLYSIVQNNAAKETTFSLLEDGDSNQSAMRYQILRFHQQQGKPDPSVWGQSKRNFEYFKKWITDNPQGTPRVIGKKLNHMGAGFASVSVFTSARLAQIDDETVRNSAAELEPGKVHFIFQPGQMVLIRRVSKDETQRDKNSAIDWQSVGSLDLAQKPITGNYGSPTGGNSASASSDMTREQMKLITRFIAAQSRTVSREDRKAMSKWFRSEWTAKGFPVTPAVEWLLKQDNTALESGNFIDDVDSIPGPAPTRLLHKSEALSPNAISPAAREPQSQLFEYHFDEKAAKLKLDAEKSKLAEMTAKWRESNSAAATGLDGEGTLAESGLAETPMPEELKQQQLKFKIAEIELERAELQLRRQLQGRASGTASGSPKGPATN